MRVLIVDDHEPVRRAIRSLLASRADWSVCGEAADGGAAIAMASRLRPDVVLMDMSMPHMDGAEATRTIRREVPEAQVVIVSQNDPSQLRRKAAEVGAQGYVAKVDLARDLIPAIEAALAVAASTHADSPTWLAGGGEMDRLMRSTDWSKTPLGPPQSWSPALRMMAKFLLANRFPQLLWWGPEFCSLYNDAYIPILGAKHPWALGQPVSKVWHEIWEVLQPLIETPFNGGPATWMEDIPLEINRRGFVEETHFTIAYSPVPDETTPSGIGGVLATVHEITEKVVAQRRVVALRDLAARSVESRSSHQACVLASETLARHSKDVPFVFIYLLDSEQSSATSARAADIDDPALPTVVSLASAAADELWPFSKVLATQEIEVVTGVRDKLKQVPKGPWSDPPDTAAVVPIRSHLAHQLAGFLIVGLSARLKFDEAYRDFLELLSTQIAITLATVCGYEEEHKRAEALAEIDRAKTLFFSNVSHEFRTPLTLMLAPLEDALAQPDALGPENRERLQVAHRNSLRLLTLVNTLLDFSRLEAGRMQAAYEPTDLSTLAAELASVFRSATDRAGLSLVVNCPPLSEPVYVDRGMWERIILNLLSNAFKFTFAGEIEVALHREGPVAKLSVRDTGTGIPANELPHLFERFHRVKGARGRTFEGSGIGLSLVQELAKLHGGTVHAESVLGVGSTFTVSIPFGKDHLPAENVHAPCSTTVRDNAHIQVQEALRWLSGDNVISGEASSHVAASVGARGIAGAAESRPRVLLADDNADMREYLHRLLSAEYDVVAVADGEAALRAARNTRPDLILTDAMMPRLDGFGLLQAIRTDETLKTIPVMLLSARAGEESRLEGWESGADDYLVKPFTAHELLARVSSQLSLARLRSDVASVERQLRLDSDLLANIVACSDDAIVSKNLDGIITSWNKSAERMFGFTASEAIGQHITLIVPPDRLDEEATILARLRLGQRLDHLETVRRRKDGSLVDVVLSISPLRNSVGRVIGASKIARDISERKRADAKFRAIFEQTTQFAGILTNEGILIEANKLCLDVCGYRAEDVLGRTFWETAWWRNHPTSQEKIRNATSMVAQGLPYRETLLYSWADGNERIMDFALYPILDERGNVLVLHPTGVDITDLKRTEEDYRHVAESLEIEVRARTAELERRNLEVLRQSELLTAFSQRLLQAQDEERRRIARELHDSAGQTLTVLGMNLAQFVHKAARVAPELANDAETVQEIVQQLHREIRTTSYLLHPPLLDETGLASALGWYVQGLTERSGLEISLDIPPDLGRFPAEMELAIFRMVQESLTNIHRHAASRTASIRVAREPGCVTLEVRDFGKGISPEKLAHIQSRPSGMGIRGMQERLRQFQGTMRIESDNSGTRILATIPVTEAANEEPSAKSAQAAT